MNDIENQIKDIERKIKEVKDFIESTGIDLSGELEALEEKHRKLLMEKAATLTPWERVQIARHKNRPNFKDYINGMIDGFVEMHGRSEERR